MGLSSKHVSNDVQDWSHGLLHSPSDDSGSGSTLELPNPPIKRRQEQDQEHKLQPPTEKLKCPRCDSTNTKFCYYNNYNKSQPRHFCKACKRHWTKGGMLRNVPVGGGRKNKRLKTTTITTTKTTNIKSSHAQMEIIGPQFLAQESRFNSSNLNEFNYNSTIFGGSSTLPQSHDLQLQFPCPSFITLDSNFPCSVSSNPYVTNSALNDKPWPSEESSINWGWDEIDKFVTADITLPWDDAEII